MIQSAAPHLRYRAITRSNIDQVPQWQDVDAQLKEAVEIVSQVLPFRTNEYLINHLIDWDAIPDDPIFQLTFPQRGMLDVHQYEQLRDALNDGSSREEIKRIVHAIRMELNPQPAGQLTHNIPMLDGEPVPGVQHKYTQTVLYFPSHGQTCHAYCTFCFRWAQFVGEPELRFSSRDVCLFTDYLRAHPEVTDVLITGGDPLIMKTPLLQQYIGAITEVDSVRSIRIGTKSLGYWPQRFVTDNDADDLLRLFERIVQSGRHLALMAHVSHPIEFATRIAQQAITRVRETGANIRMQSPIIRHVNDSPDCWSTMWQHGVELGCIPYYMFVERDTGAKQYFELPLVRCWELFRSAYQNVSGLARTVRGPSMSCLPGKCHLLGVTTVGGQRAFALEYLQARVATLVRQPFFAQYDEHATWFDQLKPLTSADEPFFHSATMVHPDIQDIRVNGHLSVRAPSARQLVS